jgi:tetratricopeptide (TPR) repeat protein
MSMLPPTSTPTPTPVARSTDEVTQPSSLSAEASSHRLPDLTPAEWEVEARAAAEEAESRDGPAAGALRYAAARILEDRLGDVAAAVDHLEAAVGRPPSVTFLPVLRALRIQALDGGSVWAAIDYLDAEIAVSASVSQRARLEVERAYLLEDRLLASEPARQALERALRLVPGHRGAMVAAQAIAERSGDPALLRDTLERRLSTAATALERSRMLTRLALLNEVDGKLVDALTLFGRALDEDTRGDPAPVARAGLRRVAARLGRDLELLRGISLEAEATAPGPARAPWLAIGASLSRYRLTSLERATASIEAALTDDPDDLALLATACEDHLAAARWDRAVDLLDRQALLTTDRDLATALRGLAGHVAEQHSRDDQAAAARFRLVLDVHPSDPIALHALERIASRTGDAAGQVELAVAAVGRADDPAERAALAMRAAEISESALHDLEAAVGLARRALDAVPGYGPAVHLLERLYPTLGRWQEMLAVVDGEAELGERTAAAAHPSREGAPEVGAAGSSAAGPAAGSAAEEGAARRLERLGLLYEERLGDPGKAMALFAEWSLLGSRRAGGLLALLRAAEKAGDALVAAEAALKLGTEVTGTPDDARVAWRYRAATLYEERAAADDEAIRAYESVLELVPTFRPALVGLARAHHRRMGFEALTRVLSRLAACEPNPAHGSALEVEAARIEAEHLARPEAALEALGRALALDTTNLGGVDYYVRVLQRLGRAEELAAALGTMAEKIADPAARAAILRRQAEVLEWQLRRMREALMVTEKALQSAGAARGRVAGLATAELVQERLYQVLGRQGDVAALQASRLGLPSGRQADDAAKGLTGRRVDLALRLPDSEQAASLLGRVLEESPGELFALEAQIALLRRLGRDRDAAAALERMAEATKDRETRVALWRSALAARERMGESPVEALPLFERMVEADPESDALVRFERLVTRRGDPARVIVARRLMAEQAPDGRTRAVFLWELGLAHAEAGDLRGAGADFERALEMDPAFLPAVRALGRLRERLGEVRAAAELLVRQGHLTKSPERAAECFRHAARLYVQVIGDEEPAAACLEELLGLEPDADADFQTLEVILTKRRENDRLAQALRRRAAAGTREQRRDRLLHLAELVHGDRPSEAAEALAAAVELDGRSVTALLRLAELLFELGRPAEAVATFRRAIAASTDPKTVSGAWIRIGDIADSDLGDAALAVSAYRTALLSSGEDIRALGGLLRGLVRQRDYLEAAAILKRLASVDPDREARVAHFIALGEMLAGPADDPEGAAEAYEQALELDPTHAAAMDRLDALLTLLDEPARLATALTRYLEIDRGATEKRLRLASLWSGSLASPQRAVEELRIVVGSRPDHVAARAELARVLEEATRVAEAVSEHLAILKIEPLRLDSLRSLRRLFERMGDRNRAGRALAALTALGFVDPGEGRALREGRARWSAEPTGVISPSDFDAYIRHPAERHPATTLLASMAEVVPRLYSVNIEDWGVSKADRLGPRSEDPIRPLVQRVATALGIDQQFDIYLARTGATEVEIDATQPPALLVPPTLLALPRQEAFLQLGRQLGRLRARTHVANRVDAQELPLLVAAGVRLMFPDYGRGAAPEDKLNELAQKIARVLPRRQRRGFEQAVLSFREGGVFDSERWRIGLSHTGYRAALVISGDVLGAFETIVRQDRRLAAVAALDPEELLKGARASAEIVEMINFALSEELATLRGRIGAG